MSSSHCLLIYKGGENTVIERTTIFYPVSSFSSSLSSTLQSSCFYISPYHQTEQTTKSEIASRQRVEQVDIRSEISFYFSAWSAHDRAVILRIPITEEFNNTNIWLTVDFWAVITTCGELALITNGSSQSGRIIVVVVATKIHGSHSIIKGPTTLCKQLWRI